MHIIKFERIYFTVSIKRRIRRILKISGWVVTGIISLVILAILVFYLGRGWIMGRAVDYLNSHQPGEVRVGEMNLAPFRDFPDVLLQLHEVAFHEKATGQDLTGPEPILRLNEVFVVLDVVDLIRGDLKASHLKLCDGSIRLVVYEDSVLNLEHALGIRFGQRDFGSLSDGRMAGSIDLERIEIANIRVSYRDTTGDRDAELHINQLESRFKYLSGRVSAGIDTDLDVKRIHYLAYDLEDKEAVRFNSKVSFDPEKRHLEVEPSMLEISGLELETWGGMDLDEDPGVDLAFRATNTGLEVLNWLFRGVLDLEEVEQIGTGSILLDGHISGGIKGRLPVISVNGTANKIGLRIKPVGRDITGISFNMHATNGTEPDMSGGLIRLEGFEASFPEGSVRGSLLATNWVSPEIDLTLNGRVDLTGLEQMVRIDSLDHLKGHVTLEGSIGGVLDRQSGRFMNDTGTFTARTEHVGFIFSQDTISDLNGEIWMQGNRTGARELVLTLNGNEVSLTAEAAGLIPHMFGVDQELSLDVTIESEVLYPERIFRDTVVSGILGEELKGLHLTAGVTVTGEALDVFLEKDSIPGFRMYIDSLSLGLQEFAHIRDMKADISYEQDTLSIHHLEGIIGKSGFSLSGQMTHFRTLIGRDFAAEVGLDYRLDADLIRAEDLFTFHQRFVLPEIYRAESLEELHMAGALRIPVKETISGGSSPDFGLKITELGLSFVSYPLVFSDFTIDLTRKGNELIIQEFRGRIGENYLQMSAVLGNFTDSLREDLYGTVTLGSDLLDLNELLNYRVSKGIHGDSAFDTTGLREPPRLDQIRYPNFNLNLDIGELRYRNYRTFGLKGKLRSTRERIFYLDHLEASGGSGGTVEFNGQFNVANPGYYNFSAELDMKDMNMNDLDFRMQVGDGTYTLKENFAGIVSASGLAEIYITPDLKLDMSMTTAMFDVEVSDGELNNFTPLQAVGRYLGNRDLNHVKFSTLKNSFTLMDSTIMIPLMSVESTLGQLLIQGEQRLDNSYLYLMYLPTWLVKEAARSRLSNTEAEEQEEEIRKMKLGKFLMLTPWSDGKVSEVRLGDKRERYQ